MNTSNNSTSQNIPTWHPNGVKKYDNQNGHIQTWHINGEKSSDVTKDHLLEWYLDSKKKTFALWKNNVPIGSAKVWNDSGSLTHEMNEKERREKLHDFTHRSLKNGLNRNWFQNRQAVPPNEPINGLHDSWYQNGPAVPLNDPTDDLWKPRF